MTDTGRFPAEGLPEHTGSGVAAGPVQGPEARSGAHAPGAHQRDLDPVTPRRTDDQLRAPGAPDTWSEDRAASAPAPGDPGHAPAPDVQGARTAPETPAAPVPQAAHGGPVETAERPGDGPSQGPQTSATAGAQGGGAPQTGGGTPGTGGRAAGSGDPGEARARARQQPPARRPLHLGPPVPDPSASLVRPLSDRGPAGASTARSRRPVRPVRPAHSAAPETPATPAISDVPATSDVSAAPDVSAAHHQSATGTPAVATGSGQQVDGEPSGTGGSPASGGPSGAPETVPEIEAEIEAASMPGPTPFDDPTLAGPQLSALPPFDDTPAPAPFPAPDHASGRPDGTYRPEDHDGGYPPAPEPATAPDGPPHRTAGAEPHTAAEGGRPPYATVGVHPDGVPVFAHALGQEGAGYPPEAGYGTEGMGYARPAGGSGHVAYGDTVGRGPGDALGHGTGSGHHEGAVPAGPDGFGRSGGVAPHLPGPDGYPPEAAGHATHDPAPPQPMPAGPGSEGAGAPFPHPADPAYAQHAPGTTEDVPAPHDAAVQDAAGYAAADGAPPPHLTGPAAAGHPAPVPAPVQPTADDVDASGRGAGQPVGRFVPVEGTVPTTPHLAPTPPHALTLPDRVLDAPDVTAPHPAQVAHGAVAQAAGAVGEPLLDRAAAEPVAVFAGAPQAAPAGAAHDAELAGSPSSGAPHHVAAAQPQVHPGPAHVGAVSGALPPGLHGRTVGAGTQAAEQPGSDGAGGAGGVGDASHGAEASTADSDADAVGGVWHGAEASGAARAGDAPHDHVNDAAAQVRDDAPGTGTPDGAVQDGAGRRDDVHGGDRGAHGDGAGDGPSGPSGDADGDPAGDGALEHGEGGPDGAVPPDGDPEDIAAPGSAAEDVATPGGDAGRVEHVHGGAGSGATAPGAGRHAGPADTGPSGTSGVTGPSGTSSASGTSGVGGGALADGTPQGDAATPAPRPEQGTPTVPAPRNGRRRAPARQPARHGTATSAVPAPAPSEAASPEDATPAAPSEAAPPEAASPAAPGDAAGAAPHGPAQDPDVDPAGQDAPSGRPAGSEPSGSGQEPAAESARPDQEPAAEPAEPAREPVPEPHAVDAAPVPASAPDPEAQDAPASPGATAGEPGLEPAPESLPTPESAAVSPGGTAPEPAAVQEAAPESATAPKNRTTTEHEAVTEHETATGNETASNEGTTPENTGASQNSGASEGRTVSEDRSGTDTHTGTDAVPAPEPETSSAPGPVSETPSAPKPAPETPSAAESAPAPGYDRTEREAVLRVMRERRDIRNGFRNDPIPPEVLLRVLEAAHAAPSVGHSQPWDFVVIRSEETRRTMHDLATRQRDAYATSLPKGRAKKFRELKVEAILETPVNIVVTADPTRGGRHTLGRRTQPQTAPYSSALAVENLWLAARAEGLGVGWVSFFDEREMVRTLGLPEHLDVVAYLCVGYVDAFPDEPELAQAGWSKRRPLSWVVHEETYGRRVLPGAEPQDLLAETVAGIRPLDAKALGEAWERQKRMTKPSGALGMLEIISAQLCGLSRMCPPPIPEPAAVVVFAGDHGVHAQGVTSWPQEVTGQMVANFLAGGAVCNAFAGQVGAEVCVVDVGVAADLPALPGLLPRKVRAGTADMTAGPALTRDEVRAAVDVGIETARDLVAAGNKALLTGEMGIANTTVSAALVAVFTGADPADVTGRGTGINDETLSRKTEVVRRALELHQPDPTDPIGVLAAVGGLEHAAMAGLLLGGASLRTPVVLDGVSAGAAALVARAIAPEVLAACIAGHRSAEPGHQVALGKLGLRPLIDLDLRLGEGTGALLALPLIQSTARAMHEVATFDSAGVTEK